MSYAMTTLSTSHRLAPVRKMILTDLPVELLQKLCHYLPRRDVCTMAQLSSWFNSIATPFIWESIRVSNSETALGIFKTILHSQRDVADMVRSFIFRNIFRPELLHSDSDSDSGSDSDSDTPPGSDTSPDSDAAASDSDAALDAFAESSSPELIEYHGLMVEMIKMMPFCLGRMKNLQHLQIYHLTASFNLTHVLNVIAPKTELRTLILNLGSLGLGQGEELELRKLYFSRLETLHVLTRTRPCICKRPNHWLGPWQQPVKEWLQDIINKHAPSLRELAILGMSLEGIINNNTYWPLLETLHIPEDAISMTFASKMPNVRKLVAVELDPDKENTSFKASPSLFPKLEEISARANFVASSDILVGRPIHRVELDGVSLDDQDVDRTRYGATYIYTGMITLFGILHRLSARPAPLREFSMALTRLDTNFITQMASFGFFKHLEQFKVVTVSEYHIPEFIHEILPHMPRVQFLAFDFTPLDRHRCDLDGNCESCATGRAWLQEWEQCGYCPALKRVNLDYLSAWEKIDGKWIRY